MPPVWVYINEVVRVKNGLLRFSRLGRSIKIVRKSEFDITYGLVCVMYQTFDCIFGLVDTYLHEVFGSPNIECECECKLKFNT